MVFQILQVAVIFGVFGIIFTQRIERPDDCKECDPSLCDEKGLSSCVAGTVLDRCGCCEVCAKAEFEICDLPESEGYEDSRRRTCGNHLECKLREDLSLDVGPEAICYCLDDSPICGTDGVTYDNKCQFHAAIVVNKDKEIERDFDGPCNSKPKIVSGPEDVKNHTHSNVYLSCEAKGYPIPEFHWSWTRADGKVISLPTDDVHISVNQRGGPDKWELTGWLIIMDLQKKHEGDYTCIAQNDLGLAKESARLNVIDDDDKHSHHKKRKNHHNEI